MLRGAFLEKLKTSFRVHRIVALLGPRQCGKTTLATSYAKSEKIPIENYFDLEDPGDLARLKDPKQALGSLQGLVIIDEIQRIPELFPVLRVLVDQHPKQRYLILGSASRDLIRQSSESLTGRVAFHELTPFTLTETEKLPILWQRGGFPRSFLAKSEKDSTHWRTEYIRTFVERDIPALGIQIPAQSLYRFWSMLAHYHGNIMNFSEFARSMGCSDTTIRRYLDILTGTFMLRQLQPFHENVGKRQVKAPKIYFRDSGILHTILGIQNHSQLLKYPKLGASWEGFALEEIIRKLDVKTHECFFWAVHSGAELDLLLTRGKQRLGFEIKYTSTPQFTHSMKVAIQDLKLSHLYVIYPGEKHFALAPNVTVAPLTKTPIQT